MEQIEDPRERQLSQMELTESWKSRVAQADWLIPYYDHILERLNSGKLVKDVPGLEDPLFFLFLNKTAEETSIEDKMQLIKQYDLAGVASWRLGYERASIWDVILKYVN